MLNLLTELTKQDTPAEVDLRSSLGRRPKVVIGHPYLGRGGSEARVMWLLQALRQDCDLTVVTTGGWNLAELNSFYGTSIRESEVQLRIAPVPRPFRSRSAAALRGSCYQRFARKVAAGCDIRISAYNPTDWGLPAIHFIADFSWNQYVRELFDPPTPGFIYRPSLLRKAYLQLAAFYASPSGRNVLRDDILVANSAWSAQIMRQHLGVECAAIVYPSVWSEFPSVPFDEKSQAFVMIGRIAPEKHIEQAIAVLDAVRRRGHALQLHLCGAIPDNAYGRTIAKLCAQHSSWITIEGEVRGERKARLLAQCRYGIHFRAAEPFGIAVAEMVKAGAICFAPNNGGQAEILDHPGLLFAGTEDAVEKIHAVLSSPALQAAATYHLQQQSHRFSSETFMHEARACVAAAIRTEN